MIVLSLLAETAADGVSTENAEDCGVSSGRLQRWRFEPVGLNVQLCARLGN